MAGPVASAKESTLVIIEVVDSPEDPLALEDAAQLDIYVEILESRIRAMERERLSNPDERARRKEDVRRAKGVLADWIAEARAHRAAARRGMCELRGWDVLDGREIILECRGQWRSRARALRQDMMVDYLAEESKRREVRSAVPIVWKAESIKVRTTRPSVWKPLPDPSHTYSWSTDRVASSDMFDGRVESYMLDDAIPSIRAVVESRDRSLALMSARLHVHALDRNGARVRRMTRPEGQTILARRYLPASPPEPQLEITDPFRRVWSTRLSVSTSVPDIALTVVGDWQITRGPRLAIRLPAPPVAPEGGYEVEVVEAVRRVK